MTPDVQRELEREGEPSEFHSALLSHVKGLVKMSRQEMSKHYTDWDMQDSVYRGEKVLDKDDLAATKRGKPTKMVVPNTFAQTMTFVSFLFLLFKQNRSFFELMPTGDEDYGTKWQDSESILERELRYNQWSGVLYQHLLDMARFGPSIIECCWTRDITRVYAAPEPSIVNVLGVETTVRPESSWQEVVKYEGNLIRAVSPYKFFPDTRYPLVDFQKGEFCAAEEEYSMTRLRDLESKGEVAGVDFIEPLAKNWDRMRGAPTRIGIDPYARKQGFSSGPGQSEGSVIVTKVQVWLVPNKFSWGDKDKKLGPEEFPILYHVWYANDNRIIRVEPAYWWHNEFGWTVAQFTPDMHRTLNLGLADLVYRLQDVISWLINSHITDVRRNVRGRFVVNPQMVETKSLDSEGDIYLRSGASGAPLDRAIRQLDVMDVTRSHMGDADLLGRLMQMVTGVNDNAMGQYNSGRRAAREVATVAAGAAGRMKMHGQLIWDSSLSRLGRLMLSNSRQSLSYEEFSKVIGAGVDPMRYQSFKGTMAEVVGGTDYFIFDSTLASERGFMAQTLQELLAAIIGNPMAAQQMDIDPRALLQEIQFLRGSGNINRFSLQRQMARGNPPPAGMMMQPQAMPQPGVAVA